jgi:hypothetical protein
MTRSLAYVRTHVSDGVCSSVLEALTLGVPVVACDNGTRPEGVITFPPQDAAALARGVRTALTSGRVTRSAAASDVPDTVKIEVDLLTSAVATAPVTREQAA